MKENSYTTAIPIFIPEYLGFIDKASVSAHIQIACMYGGYKHVPQEKIWQSRYVSLNGCEWSKIFDENGNEIVRQEDDTALETSAFIVPIEVWDLVEGYIYLTFTVYKDWNTIFCYTEKLLFQQADKFFCVRESYKRGF